MPAKFKKSEIIEYRLEIELDHSDTIYLFIKRNTVCGSWEVFIPSNTEFTIKQLIEICEAVYDAKVFDEDYDYWLRCSGNSTEALIRGKSKVAENVLDQFKISFPKEEK